MPSAKDVPTPVEGHPGGEPVEVKVLEEEPAPATVRAHAKRAAAAELGRIRADSAADLETTLRTEGQRKINLVWEYTQAAVTVLITVAAIYCAVNGIDADVLNFAFVAVISTYYARTNHTKVGGVGRNWEGR